MNDESTLVAGPCLGVRGLKARWLPDTLVSGLVRPSAAWFLLGRDAAAQVSATLAASIYLAWGRRGRAVLESAADPVDVLASQPGMLPCLLVFDDRRSGRETLHRYIWANGGSTHLTAPYAKVERAGRTVQFDRSPQLAVLRAEALPEVRSEVAARAASVPGGVTRDGTTAALRQVRPDGPHRTTRLGLLCEVAAARLRAELTVAGGDLADALVAS